MVRRSGRLLDRQTHVIRSTNLFELGDPADPEHAARIGVDFARTHVPGTVPPPPPPPIPRRRRPARPVAGPAPPGPAPPGPVPPPQPAGPPPGGPQAPNGQGPVPGPVPPDGGDGVDQPDEGLPGDPPGGGPDDPGPDPPDDGDGPDEPLPEDWPDIVFLAAGLVLGMAGPQIMELLQEQSFRGSAWHCGQSLGQGAYGSVFAAYKLNAHNTITDLTAVEDCLVHPDDWDNWIHWDGDARDAAERLPIEVGTLRAMRDRNGSEKIVRLRHNCPVNMLHHSYRIYMDHFPGALDQAIFSREGYHFEEPILWRWLEDLTEACLVMSEGASSVDAERPADWRKIVNRDIKPGNVMLGDPTEDEWRTIPSCRMADWGGAVYTYDFDPHNPLSYNYGCGTVGYRPKELTVGRAHPWSGQLMSNGRLGDHTNVWQLGATIIAAANLTTIHHGQDLFEHMVHPHILEEGEVAYSNELSALLEECTALDPDDRPELRQLQRRIREHTGAAGPEFTDLADGARGEDDAYSEQIRYVPK